MKRLIFTLLLVVFVCEMAIAQAGVKRPDSFNYQSGIDAYNAEDFVKSLEFFDKELEQNPTNGYAMVWEVYIYEKYEKYGIAMELANRALKCLPKKDKEYMGIAYDIRGQVQQALGDSVAALSDYERAFKTDGNVNHLFNKCNIYHVQAKFAEVDKEIQRAMAVNKNNAVTWVYAGRNAYEKKNYEKALSDYDYAVKLDPQYSTAYAFRADTYMAMRNYKGAAEDVVNALSVNNDSKAFLQLYMLAKEALPILVIQLNAQQAKEPQKSEWSYYLGLMYNERGKYLEAENAFKKALDINMFESSDHTKLICRNMSKSLMKLGKYEETLEMTNKCLALDSADVDTWQYRALTYYNMGKKSAAVDAFNSAIRLNPDNAFLYYWRARMYMYSDLLRNALDDINTAISLDETDDDYLLQRSEIYKLLKRYDESDADCKAVINAEMKRGKEDWNIETLAYAYVRLGQNDKALELVKELEGKIVTSGDEYNLACLFSLMDDKQQALDYFENALKHGFCEFAQIANDADLDNIRDIKKFQTLVDKYKNIQREIVIDKEEEKSKSIEKIVEVPFVREAGICKVKCEMNGLPLHFYFDTGAADVTISDVEAQFMLKNDYLAPSDIKGNALYGTADGSIVEGTVIILRKVVFGGLELSNIKASVVHNQKAPLLLGQSVLSQLGKVEIDNTKKVLRITHMQKIK